MMGSAAPSGQTRRSEPSTVDRPSLPSGDHGEVGSTANSQAMYCKDNELANARDSSCKVVSLLRGFYLLCRSQGMTNFEYHELQGLNSTQMRTPTQHREWDFKFRGCVCVPVNACGVIAVLS